MRDLEGRRVAVLVESEFVPGEIEAYRTRFPARGATVDFVSRLWGEQRLDFVSDVEVQREVPQLLAVDIDVSTVDLDDYDAVIMAANYCSVRLRMFDTTDADGRPVPITPDLAATAPAVRLFADAMQREHLVKGALCHGLWLLTPVPHLLAGRRVICHPVVLSDVVNAGGVYTPSPENAARTPATPAPGVVVDRDLVTGDSWHRVDAFIDAVADLVLTLGDRRPANVGAGIGGAP